MNCAYCKEGLAPAGDLRCVRCGTVVHGECLEERCPTLGCGETEVAAYLPPASNRLQPALTEYHTRRHLRALCDVLLAPREEVSLLVLGALGLCGLALMV